MAGGSRVAAFSLVAMLLMPALGLLPGALADHGMCPAYERLEYEFTIETRLGGDLWAIHRYAGFTDFRECNVVRDRVVVEDVRFESRGGTYTVRVAGDGFEETRVLRNDGHATAWYDEERITELRFAGVASDGTVTAEPGAPSAPDATRLLS